MHDATCRELCQCPEGDPRVTPRHLEYMKRVGIYPYCNWNCFADGEWNEWLEKDTGTAIAEGKGELNDSNLICFHLD